MNGRHTALTIGTLGVGFSSTTVSVATMLDVAVPGVAYAPLLIGGAFGTMLLRDDRAETDGADDRASGEVVNEVTP